MATACRRIAPIDGFSVRPWRSGDAPMLAAAWQDPEIARWNPVPPDSSEVFAAEWITGAAQQTVASIGVDVVLVDQAGVICGEIGLQVDPAQNVAEVGFWLRPESRGRGMGPHLLAFAVAVASALDLVGVVALTDPSNDAAIGLLRASGWHEVPTTSLRRAFAQRVERVEAAAPT